METRNGSLDKLIDRALTLYANSEPPSGMEERILANIARRKTKSQRTMRIAGLALTAILIGTVVYQPVPTDSVQTEVREVHAITDSIVPREPVQEVVEPVIQVEAPESTSILMEEESLVADLDNDAEESLVSDIELEPLTIAALDLPALAR
jgi:hypothetical protein